MCGREDIPIGARAVVEVCANVQKGEQVLVVTDTDKAAVAEWIAAAARARHAETVVMVMAPREGHGQDAPPTVGHAMLNADVIFMPTTFSLSHSKYRIRASERGARVLSMADLTVELLSEGGLTADFVMVAEQVERMAERLTRGKHLRVTTAAGTDVAMDISGRQGNAATCLCHAPGSFGSPPDIEANVAPLEGTAEGVVVVDGSIPHPRMGLLDNPVKMVVRAGRLTAFDGGREAATLEGIFRAENNPSVMALAEFGEGLNPKATLCGRMLEDEGAYGTIHFGIGANLALGGANDAPIHVDAVVTAPTVLVDGDVVIEGGEARV